MTFHNVYDDATMASAYARLAFPGTHHLAFRDLPALFGAHVKGRRAFCRRSRGSAVCRRSLPFSRVCPASPRPPRPARRS